MLLQQRWLQLHLRRLKLQLQRQWLASSNSPLKGYRGLKIIIDARFFRISTDLIFELSTSVEGVEDPNQQSFKNDGIYLFALNFFLVFHLFQPGVLCSAVAILFLFFFISAVPPPCPTEGCRVNRLRLRPSVCLY